MIEALPALVDHFAGKTMGWDIVNTGTHLFFVPISYSSVLLVTPGERVSIVCREAAETREAFKDSLCVSPTLVTTHPNPQLGAVAVGAGSVLHSDQLVVLVIVLVITAKNDTVYMVNISYTQLYKLKLELIKIKTYLY